MRLLLFLCFAGIAFGLQPGLKYTYKYMGLAQTGIPQVSTIGNSASLQADIEIEPQQNGQALMQLKNVLFGYYQGCLGCDMRATNIENGKPLQNRTLQQQIEQPFVANLFDISSDVSYSTQNEEIMWLRNMRRAIVGSFKNVLLDVNYEDSQSQQVSQIRQAAHFPRSFSRNEETIYGTCEVQYTVHPLIDFLYETVNQQNEQRMSNDVQRQNRYSEMSRKYIRGGKLIHSENVPQVEDKLYHVTRSVNFDNCNETVYMQYSSGNVRHVNAGQSVQKYLGGRQSGAEYIFRGTAKAMRMEEAVVESGISVNAVRSNTKSQIHARTNQTIVLVSVEKSSDTNINNLKQYKVKGWMQEVQSPFDAPKMSKRYPWVNYQNNDNYELLAILTGIRMTQQQQKMAKEIVLQNIQEAAKMITAQKTSQGDDEHGYVMNLLREAKLLVQGFSHELNQQLVDEVFVQNRQQPQHIMEQTLLVDTLVASGNKYNIRALMQLLKQNKLSDIQKYFVGISMANSLKDPIVIAELTEYAININLQQEPLTGSTFLVNFASVIRRLCTLTQATTVNYPGQIFGDNVCDTKLIEQKFIPYLKNIINDESKTFERIIAMKVLSQMGVSSSVQILAPVALGQRGNNEYLRSIAIYSLIRYPSSMQSRESVMQVLTEIYTNPSEQPRIRFAALHVANTWSPEPTFYYRLARLTWREPSSAMVAYYRSILTTMANSQHPIFKLQSQAATQALQYTKPMAPSNRYPYLAYQNTKNYDAHIEETFKRSHAYFNYPEPMANFDSFLIDYIDTKGYFSMNGAGLSGGGMGEFTKNIFNTFNNEGNNRQAEDLYQTIQEIIKAEPTSKRQNKVTVQHYILFNNMQLLVPLNPQIIKSYGPAIMSSMFAKLQNGLNAVLGKYFVANIYMQFVPNDMGMPVLITDETTMALANSIKSRLIVSNQESSTLLPKKAHLYSEMYYKSYSKDIQEISVIVPWHDITIRASHVSNRQLSLPKIISVDYDATLSGQQPVLEISMEPAYKQEHSIIKANSVPSVQILPLTPRRGYHQQIQSKILLKISNVHKTVRLPHQQTGIDMSLKYEGQIGSPFTSFGMQQILRKLNSKSEDIRTYLFSSPTAQYWSTDLRLNPQSSETKKITLGLSYQLAKRNIHQKQNVNIEQLYEDMQEILGYTEEEEIMQNHSFMDENKYGQGEININDNINTKSQKIGHQLGGNKVNSLSVTLDYQGQKNRKYELFYSWTKPVVANNRRQLKSQLALLSSGVPQQKIHSICFDKTKTTPLLSNRDRLQDIQNYNLSTEIISHIVPNCHGESAVTLHTLLNLSEKRVRKLTEEVHHDCDYDKHDPMHTFMQNAVYDNIRSRISFKDTKLINMLKNLNLPYKYQNLINQILTGDDQSTQMDIKMEQSSETMLWSFVAKRGQQINEVEDLQSNNLLDSLISLNTHTATNLQQIKNIETSSQKCVLRENSVRTFVGTVYEYEPTHCWTVAAKDCAHDNWLILVRKSSSQSNHPEVKILDRVNGMIIDNKEMRNVPQGQKREYTSHTGVKIAEIIKQGHGLSINLNQTVLVTISDRVFINIISNNPFIEVCGICGRQDNEHLISLLGPKHCVYSNPQDFVMAYSGPSDTCSRSDILHLRKNVDQYQRTCKTIYDLHHKTDMHNEFNMEHSYAVKQISEYNCVTQKVVPFCNSQSRILSDNQKEIKTQFRCYKQNQTPQVLRQAIRSNQKHINAYVQYEPYVIIPSNVNIQTVCVKSQ